MPIASGSTRRIAYVPEASFGSTPATPSFSTFRATGGGPRTNKVTDTSEEIRADRNVTDEMHLGQDVAGAYNTEVVKQKQKAMNALKLHGAKIEDILITLSSQLHLIKLTDDGKKFIYLVVSSRDTNLASARELLCQSAVHLR